MDQRDFHDYHEAVSQLISPSQDDRILFLDSVGSAELFLVEGETSGLTRLGVSSKRPTCRTKIRECMVTTSSTAIVNV